MPQGLIIQFDLLGGFDDGGRASIRPEDITGGVFVGSGKYVDPGFSGATPGLVDPEKVILWPEPPGGKRHNCLSLARIIHECRREAFQTEARRGFSQEGPTQAYGQFVEEAEREKLRLVRGSNDAAGIHE
jgi:hypothetical protein